MILRTSSPAPVADILKALAAAPAHGQPPHGAEERKRGGSYVKRWWENGRWNYDYGEGGNHHPSSFGANEDKTRAHHFPLPEGHDPSVPAEHAYQHAKKQHFAPKIVHQVPHPSRPHEQMAVTGNEKGGIDVHTMDGGKQSFPSHAHYEQWHRQLGGGAKTIHDEQGRPFAHIKPNVGMVKQGELQPPSHLDDSIKREVGDASAGKKSKGDPRRKAWKVSYDPQHPNAPQALEGSAVSGQHAEQQVQQQLHNLQRMGGGQTMGVSAPRSELESQLSWRLAQPGEAGQRKNRHAKVLNASPEQRRAIVDGLSQKFTPLIMSRAKKLLANQEPNLARLGKTPEEVISDIYGVAPSAPGSAEQVLANSQEGSHLQRIISTGLDNYDPDRGVPLDAYMARGISHAVNHDLTQYLKNGGVARRSGGEMMAQQAAAPDAHAHFEHEEEPQETTEASTSDPDVWKRRQGEALATVHQQNPHLPKELIQSAWGLVKEAAKTRNPEHIDSALAQLKQLDQRYPLKQGNWENFLIPFAKSLMVHARDLIAEQMVKAMNGFVTRDKGVDPTHSYSHREGTEDHPRFFYRDPGGNFLRYTNAPSGHPDAVDFGGDPAVHPAEPSAIAAPQFFSPDGRKLTRAPDAGAEVQWNPSYHRDDPQNLWIGRWVVPGTGQHAYTYVDADVRTIPELFLHQQNCLTDVRIPVLRNYTRRLSSSPHLKDRVTALALACVDQGRMRLQELGALRVRDASEVDGLWRLGDRYIFADRRARALLTLLTKDRYGDEPLFAVPMTKVDGDLDVEKVRPVGPHYLEGLLNELGLSGAALQVYHATETFSQEVQRILFTHKVPWETACVYAAATVAEEMGYSLYDEQSIEEAIPVILQALVDPIVAETLRMNAEQQGLLGKDFAQLPLPQRPISMVQLDLNQRTEGEREFSAWLHSYPVHQHMRAPMPQQLPDAPAVQA